MTGQTPLKGPWLTDDEAEKVLAYLLWNTSLAAKCLSLIALTGCEPEEARTARWDGLDYEGRRLTVSCPANRRQGGRTVPLSPRALDLLAGLARRGDCPWLFPSRADDSHPISRQILSLFRLTMGKRLGLKNLNYPRLQGIANMPASTLPTEGGAARMTGVRLDVPGLFAPLAQEAEAKATRARTIHLQIPDLPRA